MLWHYLYWLICPSIPDSNTNHLGCVGKTETLLSPDCPWPCQVTGDVCDVKFSLVGKMCDCQKTEKNSGHLGFSWHFRSVCQSWISGLGQINLNFLWQTSIIFFFQEKVQNQLSQHMNAFKRFQHLNVLTSMKMVVVLRMMHTTLEWIKIAPMMPGFC